MELIVGPMFSGKTSELLRRIRRFGYAKRSTLLIKFAADQRYSDTCVSTHDKLMIEAVSATKLSEIGERFKKFDVIGIDEGQFFEDVVEFASKAAEMGKIVIVAALDATFERKPFGHICELFPMAESIDKLTAVCKLCGLDASFSRRLSASKKTVAIGGADMYIPVCRQCFTAPIEPSRVPSSPDTVVELRLPKAMGMPKVDGTKAALGDAKSLGPAITAQTRSKSMITSDHVPRVLLQD